MAQPMAAIIGSAARAVIIATFPRLSDRKLPNSVRTRANRALNRVFRTFLNIGQYSKVSFYAEITRKLLLGPPKLRPLLGSPTIPRYDAVARADGASKALTAIPATASAASTWPWKSLVVDLDILHKTFGPRPTPNSAGSLLHHVRSGREALAARGEL